MGILKRLGLLFLAMGFLFGFDEGQVIKDIKLNPNRGRLYSHVKRLTALPKRNVTNRYQLNVAASYIKAQFDGIGLKTRYQHFSRRGRHYRNVIAEIGPKNGRFFVVGAHYDVAGVQPGADDNASGVAGLIEVARLLKQHKSLLYKRGIQVELVAYSLEEPPVFATDFMGSYIHAKSLADKKTQVELMVSLEMIGYFTDEEDSQDYPMPGMGLFYPDKGNFVAAVSNLSSSEYADYLQRVFRETTALGCETLAAPSLVPGVDFSDHRNYWEFDYAAIMVTDTAFFRNPHYHEPTDTIDTLDFKRMAIVVEGVARFLLNL